MRRVVLLNRFSHPGVKISLISRRRPYRCGLEYDVDSILQVIPRTLVDNPGIVQSLYTILVMLFMLNSCLNPVIYAKLHRFVTFLCDSSGKSQFIYVVKSKL